MVGRERFVPVGFTDLWSMSPCYWSEGWLAQAVSLSVSWGSHEWVYRKALLVLGPPLGRWDKVVGCSLGLRISMSHKTKISGVSYPPNLVHIFILLGFAKKLFLAVPEVRPNFTSSSAENTKDFQHL